MWGSPGKNTGWIAMPFSKRSFLLKYRTRVSCIAGRFFPSEPPGEPLNQDCLASDHGPSKLKAVNFGYQQHPLSHHFLRPLMLKKKNRGDEGTHNGCCHFTLPSWNFKRKMKFCIYHHFIKMSKYTHTHTHTHTHTY